jgi:hypothetical protein
MRALVPNRAPECSLPWPALSASHEVQGNAPFSRSHLRSHPRRPSSVSQRALCTSRHASMGRGVCPDWSDWCWNFKVVPAHGDDARLQYSIRSNSQDVD